MEYFETWVQFNFKPHRKLIFGTNINKILQKMALIRKVSFIFNKATLI